MSEQLISITPDAVDELKRLGITKEEFLRISLVPGGCSGLSYQLNTETTATGFDTVMYEDDDIKIVTDRESISYLKGMTVDYSRDLINIGFRFDNPNAVDTCGCGNSMRV
ncbi:MAG: iron-sulfur cluster assembly accessory protein [Spirochaetales bacterium]|nr:iron-sulfur cluster assembly accessory protein [Spirochaetales bacterium]